MHSSQNNKNKNHNIITGRIKILFCALFSNIKMISVMTYDWNAIIVCLQLHHHLAVEIAQISERRHSNRKVADPDSIFKLAKRLWKRHFTHIFHRTQAELQACEGPAWWKTCKHNQKKGVLRCVGRVKQTRSASLISTNERWFCFPRLHLDFFRTFKTML